MGMEREMGEGGEKGEVRMGYWGVRINNTNLILYSLFHTIEVLQNDGAKSKRTKQWRHKEVLSASVYMTREPHIPTSYEPAI